MELKDGPLRRGRRAFSALLVSSQLAHGLEKFRVYRMGEDDNVTAGDVVALTADIQISPDYKNADPNAPGTGGDQFGAAGYQEFVDLDTFSGAVGSEPKYISPGRPTFDQNTQTFSIVNPNSLAIEFDGVDDVMTALRVDPRDFGGFTVWSQAWVKPDSAGLGRKQYVWSLGPENGGLGISEDGRWILQFGPEVVAPVPTEGVDLGKVAFDAWSQILVRRTGNGAELYVNGSIVASGSAFWGGNGLLTVGNRAGGGVETSYDGAIDDFNTAAYSRILSPQVDFNRDIDYLAEANSGGGPADFNNDGVTNQLDYGIWSTNALRNNGIGAGGFIDKQLGDADSNGRTNFFDLIAIRNALVASDAGPVSVPEPATAGMVIVSLLGCQAVRRARRHA